ncbi:MAG TPA: DUF6599 family protein [Chthonomonadaceae bacterium]|nr:DUF6599 family protein [Chthonomonadaceae bacterium]
MMSPLGVVLHMRLHRSQFWAALSLVALLGVGLALPLSAHADGKSALPPAIGNYKTTKAGIVTYTPATLENHIDGEAEAVKRYDFKECTYAEYGPNGQSTQLITVDIYQMGTPTDAYGYYTSQRNANATVVKIGAEGYAEASALNFWKGPYYVKIAITAPNPGPLQGQMSQLAQAVAGKLTGPTAIPDIVNLLPPGYAPRTEQYRRSDIAAQSYIRNGMVAKYPSAGPRAELFVAVYPSPAAAKEAYGKYQAYLTKPGNLASGAKPVTLSGLGDSAVGVKSLFTGEVVAALKGKYLIGVRQAKDQASAQVLVKSAIAHAK